MINVEWSVIKDFAREKRVNEQDLFNAVRRAVTAPQALEKQIAEAASAQGAQGVEAVAWASPLPDGTEQVTKELPQRIFGVVPKDYQWYVRPLVYADTQPQPAVPEAKIIIDRVVEELENGFVACERCGDQEDTATLDCMTDLKRVKALLSTPTTPQADGWVSMADRHPTKSDEDCEGKIWLLWPDRRYFERVLRGSVLCSPEFFWMPTGLKRPQPPKQEGESDE